MSRSAFTKFINTLEEEDLRKELTSLYSKIDSVKKHYAMELGKDTDRKKIYDRAKKDVYNLLYVRGKPRRRPRIQKIKVLLKDLAKFSVFQHELADLYLYAAEQQMAFLQRRPSTTQATYNNCVDNFSKACDIINQLVLHESFEKRCEELTLDSDTVYLLEDRIVDIYNATFKS